MDAIVSGETVLTLHPVFKTGGPNGAVITRRPAPSSPTLRRMPVKFIDLHILPTSGSIGKANALLTEAKQNLEEYRSTMDSENYQMVGGLLAM